MFENTTRQIRRYAVIEGAIPLARYDINAGLFHAAVWIASLRSQ
jgi:hypothetical protein